MTLHVSRDWHFILIDWNINGQDVFDLRRWYQQSSESEILWYKVSDNEANLPAISQPVSLYQ